MGFCVNGTESFTLANKEDRERYSEILEWGNVLGNTDAAKQLYEMEKSGIEISPDTPLFDTDSQLIEDTLSAFDLKDDTDIARLQALIDSTKSLLKKRIKDLRKEANNLKAADKQKREDSIEELDQLLTLLEEQNYKEQFNSILGYALKNLQRSKEWLDSDKGFNPANETHVDTVLALWKQLDTYKGLNVPEYAQKHSQLSAKITEVNILYRDVKKSVEAKFLDTIVNLIQQNTTNDKFSTREDILAFLKESNDIDGMQKWFLDMNSSSDTLLAVINKVYAYKLREIEDVNAEWHEKINAAGRNLVAAGIKDYEWMVEKDEKGKRTGNIVKRVQKAFYDKLNELYALQDTGEIDEFGKKIKKQYIKKRAEEMSDDEIAFNIQLHADKSALYAFTRAEFYDKKNKKLSDGENKRYTQDFKDQRAWFEVYAGNEWVKSANGTQEEYDKYIKTFYGPLTTINRMISDREETEDSNGNTVYGDWYKTGEIEEVETRFVKDLYVEITDAWNTKEYRAIQANPAMKEFYDFYANTVQHILDRLPADVARKMQNKIFRFRDDYMSELLKEKTSVIKKVLQKIKGIFLPEIVTSNIELDENNMPIQSVGIYGTGDLRNEKKIADIQAEITKLAGTKDKAERIKLDRLKTSLLIEKNKLVADELVLDLVVSLQTAVGMAHAYDIKSSVQSTFHIAQEVIKNRKFYETDGTGKVKLSKGVPVLKTGVSNVQDRLETWMRMVFYNNSQANDSRIAKIGKLLKTYVSLKNVGGFAIFPAINNAITAEMSNIIEGAGGVFYETQNFAKASLMFAKTLASGKFVSHLFKQPGKYEDVKPVDKLTALVEYYNYLEENSDTAAGIKTKQSGKEYIMSGNVFYALTESVEYQAQTRSAIAYLDHKLVNVEEDFEYIDYFGKKQKTENKKIPLLEAHTFDEVSKKLVLRKGVIFDVKMKRQTSEEIRNMNKNIHGNYSSTDKVAMQENWYGELAFQFKKWMPNAIRNRFGGYHGGYYDESTGMDMVGRYWAVGTMVRNMTTLGNMFNGETWKTLTPLEQANMRKNVAEAVMFATFVALYVIFGAIAEGIPPDDEYTKMAVNFLKMQADKSRSEITFFVNPTQWYQQAKNPVAGLRTMGEIGEFFTALVGVPFYGLQGKSEKLKYDKGINKGEYKVWKEFRDLLPGLAQTNQVKQLGVTGEFFIK